MKIAHLALWTSDLERCKAFYVNHFGGCSNEKYVNTTKGFESYFLTFNGGAALEIMRRMDVTAANDPTERVGLAHFAVEVGGVADVDSMVEQLRADGVPILGEPRRTGDGFYEALVLDPDGNRVEIVAQ